MTVKFYLNHPKNSTGELRKTEVSIVAKVKQDERHQFEVPTGERIVPRYWDFKTQTVKASHIDQASLNLFLSKFKVNLISLYRDNREKTWAEYRDLVRGRVQKKTLEEAFKGFLKAYTEQGKDYKTIQTFEGLKAHMGEYSFEEFNSGFPLRFREKIKDHKDTTFYKIIRRLKTFLAWAKEKGFPTGNEFEKWEVLDLTMQPIAFTLEELTALEQAILPKHLAEARDYFVVSCRTGLRFSDLKRLDVRNMEGFHYTLITKKKVSLSGGKEVTLSFAPGTWSAPALDILLRHGGKLPERAEQTLNDNLKTACDQAKIHRIVNKEFWKKKIKYADQVRKCDAVTMHWGKKTFITLALGHGVPLIEVSQMSATSMKVIEKNYAGLTGMKRKEEFLRQMVKSA